jgi:hypothetical protein
VRARRVVVLLGSVLPLATIVALAGAQAADGRPRPDSGPRRVTVRDQPFPRRQREPERISRKGRLPDPDAATLNTAYRDAKAREIIAAARVARFRQDSTLTSYDATVKQRLSAGLNVKTIGAERLLFRSELAARVRWTHSNRIWVDMLGARSAVPVSFPGARVLTGVAEMVPIPYFTGSEQLMWWFNFDGDDNHDNDDETPFSYVNPLERGAEAVYEYRSGDSALVRLPGNKEIRLREITVRAREASSDLIIGSLWFDTGSGQLVRAAFKPAAPFARTTSATFPRRRAR